MKKLTTRTIRKYKLSKQLTPLQMLTCYDFQNAQMLAETEIDLLLVGDSLGNVLLGYDTTVQVSLEEMKIFSSAVRQGAPNKFIIADLPFGTYASLESGLQNAFELFQKSGVEALKLEGAHPSQLELIERLTQNGVPIMGHIGLTPQSVHEMGGYYVHGKDESSAELLLQQALNLQAAGAFAVVLECVFAPLAEKITEALTIPTIGIGSGEKTDGQVLVINDLLKNGPKAPPKFCQPIADLFELKKGLVNEYLATKKQAQAQIDSTLS
jgi:3-methyl-2-oxobutanoate hydroxymethyltransferase